VAVPPGVNETRSRVNDESQSAEARLALEAGHEVVGDCDALQGRAQHELTGVQNHGLFKSHVNQLRQVLLGLLDVNDGVRVVAEDPKELVDVQVNRGGLNAVLTQWVDNDATLVDSF